MRLLLGGDTHADFYRLEDLFMIQDGMECDELIILGDFGWWPYSTYAREKFLDKIDRPVTFIDGNHEYHRDLPHDAENLVQVHHNVFYWPRGLVRNINGAAVLGIGGAASIDRDSRTPEIDWFPNETATYAQIARCLEHKSVDVVLAHDFPVEFDLRLSENNSFSSLAKRPHIAASIDKNRSNMSTIWKALEPEIWAAGHYHKYIKQLVHGTQFICLAGSQEPLGQAWSIIEIETPQSEVSSKGEDAGDQETETERGEQKKEAAKATVKVTSPRFQFP